MENLENKIIDESVVESNTTEVKEVKKDLATPIALDKTDTKKETSKPNFANKGNIKPHRRQATPSEFDQKVVQIKRISKTTKGGRSMRFSALVVIGNKKGQVGYGLGKSIEVPDAIKKAIKNANNNIVTIRINKNGTVNHENIGRHGAGKILVKPAPQGTGIIAGGSVRAVVELAGYHNIYTKCLGSNTPVNVIRATINGLVGQYSAKDIAKLRDKKLSEL